MCSQHWKPKSTNFSHARQSQNMEHKPILKMTEICVLKVFDRSHPIVFCDNIVNLFCW